MWGLTLAYAGRTRENKAPDYRAKCPPMFAESGKRWRIANAQIANPIAMDACKLPKPPPLGGCFVQWLPILYNYTAHTRRPLKLKEIMLVTRLEIIIDCCNGSQLTLFQQGFRNTITTQNNDKDTTLLACHSADLYVWIRIIQWWQWTDANSATNKFTSSFSRSADLYIWIQPRKNNDAHQGTRIVLHAMGPSRRNNASQEKELRSDPTRARIQQHPALQISLHALARKNTAMHTSSPPFPC